MDNKIEKLNFLLNEILNKESIVSYNIFYKTDFYISDNGNDDRMKSEFKELIKEFERIGIGNIIDDGNGLIQNINSMPFKEDGGFSIHYENKKNRINKENEKQGLKDEIDRLIKTNLLLQNKELRNKIWYSIIGFTIGAILTNVKEILILLKMLPQ